MGRKRKLTDEQICEKYGSVAAYEAHMASVRKYQAEHADELRQYRWNNRYKLRERATQYRKDHPEQYERTKGKQKERRRADPEYALCCKCRINSRCLAIDLGIYPENSNIHHCFGWVVDSFVVLDRDDHLLLHSMYGRANDRVGVKEILKNRSLLIRKPVFVYKGEVVSAKAVRSLA
ncbi:MAG: hypothetical protein IIY21_28440 [Clostridiales bacterium]|nr:hypothetical protein [Clostridiales bacterium]MBQ1570394.1 hypothetical protein [Clostridiales bacterium]